MTIDCFVLVAPRKAMRSGNIPTSMSQPASKGGAEKPMMIPERIASRIRERIEFGNNCVVPGASVKNHLWKSFEELSSHLSFLELAISGDRRDPDRRLALSSNPLFDNKTTEVVNLFQHCTSHLHIIICLTSPVVFSIFLIIRIMILER